MCSFEFNPSFDFTEYICYSCKNEGDHDECDMWTEEACACRNSGHMIDNRDKQRFIDEWLKAYT